MVLRRQIIKGAKMIEVNIQLLLDFYKSGVIDEILNETLGLYDLEKTNVTKDQKTKDEIAIKHIQKWLKSRENTLTSY